LLARGETDFNLRDDMHNFAESERLLGGRTVRWCRACGAVRQVTPLDPCVGVAKPHYFSEWLQLEGQDLHVWCRQCGIGWEAVIGPCTVTAPHQFTGREKGPDRNVQVYCTGCGLNQELDEARENCPCYVPAADDGAVILPSINIEGTIHVHLVNF
jgi:hypothetical protein